jgi:hypothetical protein
MHGNCVCRDVRAEEDAFATDVVRGAHSAYKRGVANTIKGKSKEAQRQLKHQADSFHERLDVSRAGASRELEVAILAERRQAAEEADARCSKVRLVCALPWRLPNFGFLC